MRAQLRVREEFVPLRASAVRLRDGEHDARTGGEVKPAEVGEPAIGPQRQAETGMA